MLTMKGEPAEGVSIVADLEGEVLLGIENTWPHVMSLEGDLEMSGDQGERAHGLEFSGSGPMKRRPHCAHVSANSGFSDRNP